MTLNAGPFTFSEHSFLHCMYVVNVCTGVRVQRMAVDQKHPSVPQTDLHGLKWCLLHQTDVTKGCNSGRMPPDMCATV